MYLWRLLRCHSSAFTSRCFLSYFSTLMKIVQEIEAKQTPSFLAHARSTSRVSPSIVSSSSIIEKAWIAGNMHIIS